MIYSLKFNSYKIKRSFMKNKIIWIIKLPNSNNKIKIKLINYKLEFKSLKNNEFKINWIMKIN